MTPSPRLPGADNADRVGAVPKVVVVGDLGRVVLLGAATNGGAGKTKYMSKSLSSRRTRAQAFVTVYADGGDDRSMGGCGGR
jgi:hypothetical protein